MPRIFCMKNKFRKLVIVTLFVLILLTLPVSRVGSESMVKTAAVEITTKQLDNRAVILKDYLAQHNSPLQYHAQDFIDAADTYKLDYKLVPAISGVESTFGKAIPGGYNGWGWGVYGNQALYFNSWRDGIFTVSRGLRENYINRGLTDPFAMNRIYAASPSWGTNVSYFQNDIAEFAKAKSYLEKRELPAKYSNIEAKTAGTSAKLAFKN